MFCFSSKVTVELWKTKPKIITIVYLAVSAASKIHGTALASILRTKEKKQHELYLGSAPILDL